MDAGSGVPFSQVNNNIIVDGHAGIIEKIVSNCADKWSDNVAVRYGESAVTYSEVLILAKKVAASIQSNSVDSSPVGLICSKNSNFVPAWLGGILSGKLFFQIDG